MPWRQRRHAITIRRYAAAEPLRRDAAFTPILLPLPLMLMPCYDAAAAAIFRFTLIRR